MENEDMSNIIEKFSDILKEKNININDFIPDNNENANNSEKNNDFNIDINTILKFKNIADKLNSSNDPRSSLLKSLKPFLSIEKQEKLDEYIKIVKVISILEILNKDL